MFCPECGSQAQKGQRFCGECGTQLPTEKTTTAPLTMRHNGERRLATVLLVDIAGFTTLAERLDPEHITMLVNAAFDRLAATVRDYDGTVDKYIGDAMMVLFGVPSAHEDDPARAVRCALDMVAEVAAFNQQYRDVLPNPISLHVGIDSGLVVSGQMGAANRSFRVIGDVLNVAARLEAASGSDEILVSETTHRLVAALFDWGAPGSITVKDRVEAATYYPLLGARRADNRLHGGEGLRAPLIGRRAEVDDMRRRIADLPGVGGLVALFGEPGLGKSRLLAELRQNSEGVLWAEGRCLSYGQRLAYYPWRELIANLLDLPLHDAAAARDRLREQLRSLGVARSGETAASLNYLLGISSEETLAQGERRVAQAVGNLLRAVARRQPTVIVLEDLHWADERACALLCDLTPDLDLTGVLLIGSCRPDDSVGAESLARCAAVSHSSTTLHLQPLSASEAPALVTSLLKAESLPESVRSLILERSEGNPFFIEETLRNMIDSGQLRREEDTWRVESNAPPLDVPTSLLGVIAARVDLLPTATKSIMQVASVLGRRFDLAPLAWLLGEDEAGLRAALTELEQRQLVQPTSSGYNFKNTLIQEVAYATLLLEDRRRYHRLAGDYYCSRPRPTHAAALVEVQSLFDAFYHYTQAQGYAAAFALSNLTVDQQSGHPMTLDQALERWGEHNARASLYHDLLPHLPVAEQQIAAERLAAAKAAALGEEAEVEAAASPS